MRPAPRTWHGARRSWRTRSRETRKRASSRCSLPPLPASKVPDRLEVDVEVVRRGTQRTPHAHPVLVGDRLEAGPHVRRQLAPADAAECVSYGLVEVATRTAPALRQASDVVIRVNHPPASLSRHS